MYIRFYEVNLRGGVVYVGLHVAVGFWEQMVWGLVQRWG